MAQAITLGLLAGLILGNGIPHFIKGITNDRYPTVFGSGPIVNFLGGSISIGIAALLLLAADLPSAPIAGSAAVAVGTLAMGLVHAAGIAFGRH